MTDEEWLKSHGWLSVQNADGKSRWESPDIYGMTETFGMLVERALIIQLAKDKAEERDIYRRVYAATIGRSMHTTLPAKEGETAVAEYLARYGRNAKIVEEP